MKGGLPPPSPQIRMIGLHRHDDEGKAGNEQCDGSECCNVSNDIGHLRAPYSLCFLFVLFLFRSQWRLAKFVRDHRDMS
jgi:hypothetical protein